MNDKRVIVAMALLLVLLMAGAGYWLLHERPVENRPTKARNLDLPQDEPRTNGTPLATGNTQPVRQPEPQPEPQPQPDIKPLPDETPPPQPDALPNVAPVEVEGSWARISECDNRHYIVLRGIVLDHADAAVADAEIWAHAFTVAGQRSANEYDTSKPATSVYSATRLGLSGFDGRFEVVMALAHNWVSIGSCEVSVSAVAAYGRSPTVKEFSNRDRKTHELKLKIPALGGLSGRVVDELGVGVSGIRVQAHFEPTEGSRRAAPSLTVSDDAGGFVFTDLVPGQYRISVAHGIEVGKPDSSLRAPAEYQPVKPEVYGTVVVGVVTPLADEPVVKLRTIVSLTLELDGKPLAAKSVTVELHGGEVVIKSAIATDAAGTLRITDPPEGTTRVTLTVEGCEPTDVVLSVLLPGQVNEVGHFVLRAQ